MKFLLGLLLCFFIQNSYAEEKLIKDCEHLEGAAKADFVLFSKKEFIELGECLAVSFLNKKIELDLIDSCDEVHEDKNSTLGILSLSKLEAIKIGQCIGVINAIHNHYDNKYVDKYYKRSTFHCIKGEEAVAKVRNTTYQLIGLSDIRDVLCESY